MISVKKYTPLIIGILVVFALEILVFNFSSIISVMNQPINFSDRCVINPAENGYEVEIDGIDEEIHNLCMNIGMAENEPVYYTITIFDEGNALGYELPQGMLTKKSLSSQYINLHPYGQVSKLLVSFSGTEDEFRSIMGNVRRPLMFNFARVFGFLLIVCFFFGLRKTSYMCHLQCDYPNKNQQLVTVLCAAFIIFLGYLTICSHSSFDESSIPHHMQYKELARAICDGHFYVDDAPSEGLLQAPNPYDTQYLQANNIEYRADYAYFNGKYYVYFGIVPELLLYLPFHMITGHDFPNWAATFVFYALFCAGVFLFVKELIRKHYKLFQYIYYVVICAFICLSGTIMYVVFNSDIYSVPIIAGAAFTFLGLAFWLVGVRRDSALFIVLGSLFMALTAGCRPQYLLFGFLAFPIFKDYVLERKALFTKRTLVKTIICMLPYAFVAVLVMYYNNARFGSIFDFGATYSLTNNDMNLSGNSISRMLLGLMGFTLQPPLLTGVFPFLQSVPLEYSYMGKIVTEHYFGGIIPCNMLMFSLAFAYRFKDRIKEHKLSSVLYISIIISVIIALVDANTAGILQRYTVDVAMGLFIATAVMLSAFVDSKKEAALSFIKIGFVFEVAFSLMMISNTVSAITLEKYNPELFNFFADVFRF